MSKLFGDGLHDDHPAIQALLDSGVAQVDLPSPAAHYCISKTLRIHGGQTLRLPRTAVIRLLPGSDCLMLANAETDSADIAVEGGIGTTTTSRKPPTRSFPAPSARPRWRRTPTATRTRS